MVIVVETGPVGAEFGKAVFIDVVDSMGVNLAVILR